MKDKVMDILRNRDGILFLEKLQKIMIENALSIRAIPKTVRGVVETIHKEEFPEGHPEYLETFKREMWVYYRHPAHGGQFVVESKCGTGSLVRFPGKRFYDSLEEIIKEYE